MSCHALALLNPLTCVAQGMWSRIFDPDELENLGGIQLDEFASCLSFSLGMPGSAVEHTRLPVMRKTLENHKD